MARSLKQHFTDWCRQQGDAEYDYWDGERCAFARFLRENGYAEEPSVGGYCWYDQACEAYGAHPYDKAFADCLYTAPYTYAALADRLAA